LRGSGPQMLLWAPRMNMESEPCGSGRVWPYPLASPGPDSSRWRGRVETTTETVVGNVEGSFRARGRVSRQITEGWNEDTD
jgi:hypothetical protein